MQVPVTERTSQFEDTKQNRHRLMGDFCYKIRYLDKCIKNKEPYYMTELVQQENIVSDLEVQGEHLFLKIKFAFGKV